MKTVVVVEGESDVMLFQSVFASQKEQVKFLAGGSRFESPSFARSLLVYHHLPVVLMIDSDATNKDRIIEEQISLKSYLDVAALGVPTRVISIVPCLEAIFFTDDSVTEKIAGRRLTDVEKVEAQYNPKKILHQLLGVGRTQEAILRLGPSDFDLLRNAPPMRELQQFLDEVKAYNESISA